MPAVVMAGLRELQATITAAQRGSSGKVLVDAARAGASIIRDEIRSRAPVGKTGRIKKSVLIKVIRVTPEEVWMTVGPRSASARFIEFGTSKMSAKPFARPAYDAAKDRAMEAVENVIRAAQGTGV